METIGLLFFNPFLVPPHTQLFYVGLGQCCVVAVQFRVLDPDEDHPDPTLEKEPGPIRY